MESNLKKKGHDRVLIYLARAALANYHKPSGLNNRNLLSHSSGGQFRDQGVAGPSLLGKVFQGSVPASGSSLASDSIAAVHVPFFLGVCQCPNFPFL